MTFEGRVWRYLPAGAHPLHFHHLIHAAGRWNRRGLYGCLYAALTPSGAVAEHGKHERRRGLSRPRDLVALDVWVDPVFDLVTWLEEPRPIRVPGLPGRSRPPDLSRDQATGDGATDLEACRRVADWVRTHGFVAVLAPSAALEGERVLAIYPENAPRHLRLLETGVRHPLNYGDRAVLDAHGQLRRPL